MNSTTTLSRQSVGLPQQPLALCLALALGIGVSGGVTAAADRSLSAATTGPEHTRQHPRITSPAGLPRGSTRRAFWEHVLANRPPPRPATTLPVTNCNDSGAGSLRDAVSIAVDGDDIDMTGLACSTITLTTGALVTGADNLGLNGTPGALTIQGSGVPVFVHLGTGTLAVNGLYVTDGYKYASGASGACIFSSGDVSLYQSTMMFCNAFGTSGSTYPVRGGAIYAAGDVILSESVVSFSYAYSPDGEVYGGGVFTGGAFVSSASEVKYNSVAAPFGVAFNGGVRVEGGGTVKYSSIHDNHSYHNVGGISFSYSSGATATIVNSTISGNTAADVLGGVQSSIPLSISNSTIAFNTETHNGYYAYSVAAGLNVFQAPLTLQSSIVANNYNIQYSHSDVGGYYANVYGANNLVHDTYLVLPADTIKYTDPQLLALGDNGGPTLTHALGPTSPAIHAGNNSEGKYYDQRGNGFPRVVGANADIGAFESSVNDTIFADGFDV